MIWRWFTSKAVRDACTMRKHVYHLFSAQRDLLSPMAIGAMTAAMNELKSVIAEGANAGKIRIKAEELEFAANKWLKPYPNPVWRENVEVLLVAIAVAMGVRTFFLQPFKIPTGSMQPTLYGVISVPDYSRINPGGLDQSAVEAAMDAQFKLQNNLIIPGGWERFKEWFEGISYVHVVAQNDGPITGISPMRRFLIFNIKQTIWIGGVAHTMWFPPDFGEAAMEVRSGLAAKHFLNPDRIYHKGEDLVKLQMRAGDHLFVDRFTYNFRKPDRGEIVVFETQGIPEDKRNDPYGRWQPIPAYEFYIKRLVGLGGDKIEIGSDRHLIIDGKRLDSSTPHFENIYSFDPKEPPKESQYSGHVSQPTMPYFPDNSTVYQIPDGHVMVMGDNTMNSLDSRYWGDFPMSSIIGKSFFVYWPITSRFGWGNR